MVRIFLMVGLALAACGGTGAPPDGGSSGRTDAGTVTRCSTSAECGASEWCHDLYKVCAKLCATDQQCGSISCRSYVAATDAGNVAMKYCGCRDANDCETEDVCNPDGTCAPKCSASAGSPTDYSCPAPLFCEGTSHTCRPAVCSPACAANQACVGQGGASVCKPAVCSPPCALNQYCDGTTSPSTCKPVTCTPTCSSPQSCDWSSASPACVAAICSPACGAGQYCDGTGAVGTCMTASCSPACISTEWCDKSGTSPVCVAKCTPGSCGAGKVCNGNTYKCETAKTCSTANAQPDTCGYGQYCAASTCTEVTKPTCGNWTPPAGKTPVFDPAVSTGPIIYSVVDEATNDDAFCTTPAVAFTTTLTAYRTDIAWPSASSGLSGFKYVNTSGSESDATQNLRPSGYTKTGNVASFKLTICGNALNASIIAGFYFTNGNEVCATIVR